MKSSSNFFDFVSFLLSSLVTDPSFMSILSLALVRKSEKNLSDFCPISGDWGEWRIPNLTRTSLIKCHWILQNAKVTAFTVSELSRENQQGVSKITLFPHPPRLGLRDIQHSMSMLLDTRFHIWLIMALYFKMRQLFNYKMRQVFYYKMWVLLQNATVMTKCDVY